MDEEPEGAALAQIKEKGYAEPYRLAGKEVHGVGIEFSRQKRNIVAWDMNLNP